MLVIKLKKDKKERLVYISDELLEEAKNKYLEQGYEYAILQDNKINQEIQELQDWFNWYDNQASQAQRAERTNKPWSAIYGDKTYYTLMELDEDANKKQEEIRKLKIELRDL